MSQLPNSFALVADPIDLAASLKPLAAQLGVDVCSSDTTEAEIQLVLTPERLELRQTGKNAPGPVYVDFVSGKAAHRRQYGGGRGQPLAKAVGLKKGITPRVLDATAGLGRDAFVLATLGCEVMLVERSPIIAALLADGLQRALSDSEVAPIASRMQLTHANSIEYLKAVPSEQRPDVVYLDPMYPHRGKSALVKKEMRVFRQIVGDDLDTEALLEAARACVIARVVVKRPAKAEHIGNIQPSYSLNSPNTRYDIYVNKGLGS